MVAIKGPENNLFLQHFGSGYCDSKSFGVNLASDDDGFTRSEGWRIIHLLPHLDVVVAKHHNNWPKLDCMRQFPFVLS